ncbi:unnamed protein product [Rotaria sp. Silwood1]|nr:unnamed protein product [Rotaria sp. Silwood1]CAF1388156.1 unnamed protein product [Rotaria sp. Silwood1]CAF3527619.1 unnamed protein product [Rotaria sp. Silwood1]CAF3605135.1 unnamed protein product [Rotaria sp. Silwood1]CAF4887199.1 unnamed protein product [Rotaria sp. Silwood1]
MATYYSYVLSLLVLLLITHWTKTASLHVPLYSFQNKTFDHRNSPIINSEYSKSKSINAQLPLIKRHKRWKKNTDNDELEIAIDKLFIPVNNSIDISSSNSFQFNMTTFEVYSDENTTMNYSLLRQNSTEINQTDDHISMSIIENVLQDNKTDTNDTIFSPKMFNELIYIDSIDSKTFITNITDIYQIITNDKNESITDEINNLPNEFQSSSLPIIFNQTIDEVESTTASIHLDYTTISYTTTDNNQTYEWGLLFNDKTETIPSNDSSTIATNNEFTINSNIIDQDMNINNTNIIIDDINQNFNETSFLSLKSINMSICDRSCQCIKQCPYGFEILNDTCRCNPPCKNYQCFGNDTCIITDKGQPLCQSENGIEHDRPTRCYQPRDAGYHDINIQYHNRWYYNPDQDTCHLFIYRGLGGNENNFQTLHECHLECIICAPLPNPGECLGHVDMWYYDNKKNECNQFEYSGCRGNQNQFLKKEHCIDICINRIRMLK